VETLWTRLQPTLGEEGRLSLYVEKYQESDAFLEVVVHEMVVFHWVIHWN
jgi:hypothetical protein